MDKAIVPFCLGLWRFLGCGTVTATTEKAPVKPDDLIILACAEAVLSYDSEERPSLHLTEQFLIHNVFGLNYHPVK